jgi:hypothetical protein
LKDREVGSPAEENGQWPLDAIPSSLPTTQLRSGRQSDGFSDIPPTKRPAFLPAQFARDS